MIKTNETESTLKVTQLDETYSGECPCGCGEAAFPFGAEGYDGYVDAAPACARKLLGHTIEDGVMEPSIPWTVMVRRYPGSAPVRCKNDGREFVTTEAHADRLAAEWRESMRNLPGGAHYFAAQVAS